MKKQLNHLFQEYLKEVDYDFLGGSRYVFIFENEYGATVISQYNICYDSGITDDVIGYLSDEQVNEYLGIIKNLSRV